ncbi:CaiB/BaiF CoA transferase family protein [Corynebacterium comes]|uniref:Formyl-coenzyme A transferase n=1 Tax=Corynebacterium comes TaxID=2675218 RepID=A0A6B8VKF9_9CORY|nr:CaiB/BaiF CoA-transferase family protein [Corynebacterium comes]QGU05882.1 Formyl-coenzyme A transferase [Corynebacterium comes]
MKLLDGIKVLDLTNVLSGPFAGYQLALMGADVLKIEALPFGDLARKLGASTSLSDQLMGISFLAQNSEKRSMTLNLKSEEGKEVFARLVESYDVVLENFRPGVMERLGFGWEELKRLNPGVIYCSVSGFGQEGPLRKHPAYDQIIQGMSGLMAVTGDDETSPLRVGAPISDTIGGFAAAFAISSALVNRARTGEGVHLDVSMLDATLVAMGWVASDYLVGGRLPVPMGNENRTAAPSGTFETSDGGLNIAANKQEQFEALCRAIDRTDLIEDPRFAGREARKSNRTELKVELDAELSKQSKRHWSAVLPEAGVPAAPVMNIAEALASEQIAFRKLVATLDLGDVAEVPDNAIGAAGTVSLLGSPVHINGTAVIPKVRPPRLGEHTTQVMTQLGFTEKEISELQRKEVV